MLELKDIKKTYLVGDIKTEALKGISVAFREKEFVAILGPSGCGKTTCLNIIGGLDRYDSGDLIIKGKSTKKFSEREWDAYRNNSIGFVFQSYNLITHLSIVQNVELGMTLSGVPAAEKHQRALDVLEKVGLKEHLHKRPNQLSGGQMQRVAIARALANDPEILLCDEPTGALDTATSIQIMDLLKEVSKEKLVIMVTHNPELADRYADRIIRFKDGELVDDTHPHQERPKPDSFLLKRTSMKFRTALNLSFNNIRTKKGRTFLTAFASSIGIIGIAVILSLSSGFQTQIDSFQSDTMAEFPILISPADMEMDMEAMSNVSQSEKEGNFPDTQAVEVYDKTDNQLMHTNVITEDYLNYVKQIDPELCSSVGTMSITSFNLLYQDENGDIKPAAFPSIANTMSSGDISGMTSMMAGGMSSMGMSSFPVPLTEGEPSMVEKNYDLLAGSYPTETTDLVLIVDKKNRVDVSLLEALGWDASAGDSIDFDDIVGKQFQLVDNNDWYQKSQYGNFIPSQDYEALYGKENNITLTISGVVRIKEEETMSLLSPGIAYRDDLNDLVLERAENSDIVKAQAQSDINVMTMEPFNEGEKQQFMQYLGGDPVPLMILVYPQNFEDKEEVLNYLDAYNEGLPDDEKIIANDLAGTMSDMTSGIMDGITIVLIAFAAISLVVSLIMICIITYTSVLERTKEIGILRALGARKKDITRVFDAETCILGVFSGLLGVAIAFLCTIPINIIIENLTGLVGVSHLRLLHAVLLVAISTVLTILGGHIPARMASKKDAVEALRSE